MVSRRLGHFALLPELLEVEFRVNYLLLEVSLCLLLDLDLASDLPLGSGFLLRHDFNGLLDLLSLLDILKVLVFQVGEVVHQLLWIFVEDILLVEVFFDIDKVFSEQLVEPMLPVLVSHLLRLLVHVAFLGRSMLRASFISF